MVSINIIKSWFQRGMKPTAAQFAAVFDSFWHKSEKIQISDVESLDSELSDIKDTVEVLDNSYSVNFSYQDGTPIATQEVNEGGFIAELPAVEDDKTRNSWQGKKLSELVNITEDTDVIRHQFPDRTKYVFGWENGTMNYSDTEFMEDKEILTTLSLPDGTETVSWHAFINCVKLCAVTLPEELLEIKDGAFKGCKNLVEINLPASLTAIGAEAFYAAPILYDLDLTAMDVETIGDYAFSGTKLNSVVVSDTVELGEGVFSRCTRLKSVTLPATLEEIPDHSFDGCSLLRDIELPSALMSVGDYAFAYSGLYSVTLPVGTNIGSGAFAYCSELGSVVIPEGIGVIGAYAFAYCDKLGSLELPEGIETLEKGREFAYSGLDEISLPSTLKRVGSSFSGCSKLQEVTLPAGIEQLSGTFEYCESLERVTFDKGDAEVVEDLPELILDGTFSGCTSLREVNFRTVDVPAKFGRIGDYKFPVDETFHVTKDGTFSGYAWDAIKLTFYTFKYQMMCSCKDFAPKWEDDYMGVDDNSGATVRPVRDYNPDTDTYYFTVDNNRRVVFAPGNVHYDGSIYTFLSNQYTYGRNASADNRDLFDFKADWNLESINGDAAGTWNTMTRSEWDVLLARSENGSVMWTHAKVNGIYGLVLLPDGWNNTSEVTMVYGHNYGDDNVNSYTVAEWEALEALGAVFLPGAGNYENHQNNCAMCMTSSPSIHGSYSLSLGDTITFTEDGMEGHLHYQYSTVTVDRSFIFSDYRMVTLTAQCQFRLGSKVFEPGIYTVSLEDGVVKTTGNTSIYSRVFKYTGLTHIEPPEGVTGIYQEAFACSALESVVLPASVNNMGDWVFSYCESIGSIDLSRTSIASIGSGIMGFFGENHNITLYLPHSVYYCGGQFGSVKELVVTSDLTNPGAFIRSEDLTRLVFARAPYRLDKDMFKYSWESLLTNNIEVIEFPYMWEPDVSAADNIFFAFPGITTETLDIMLNRLGYAQNGSIKIYVHSDRQGEIPQTTLDRLATRGYTIEYTIP